MHFSLVSLIGLGAFTSTVLADDLGRGTQPLDNDQDITCNTDTVTRRLKGRFPGMLRENLNGRATPQPSSADIAQVVKRSGVYTVDSSCDAPPPSSASANWGPFTSMHSIIDQAFADAMTLATRAKDMPQNHPALV